jgi:hypothetical protein
MTVSVALAMIDRAVPIPVSMTLQDVLLYDGIVDRVSVVFSETLSATTLKTNWTIANSPSGPGAIVSTVGASTATVTINLTGGTLPDTTVGAMTVAMAQDAVGVRDPSGNLAQSFAPTAPVDGAGPAPRTVTDTNGAFDGRIEPGDSLVIALSEPLGPAVTLPSTVVVTLDDPVGGTVDNLLIPGILSGPRSTGSNSYIVIDGTSAAFDGSTVLLSEDRKTITITVGPTCAGTACGAGLGTLSSAVSLSLILDATLKDQFGFAPPIGAKTWSIRLF